MVLIKPKEPEFNLWHQVGIPSRGAPLFKAIDDGFPFQIIEKLSKLTGFGTRELANCIGIPSTTFYRRAKASRFNSKESDQLYLLVKVFDNVLQLCENNTQDVHQWMSNPIRALGYQNPINMLKNCAQVDEVLNIIGCLKYGVYC